MKNKNLLALAMSYALLAGYANASEVNFSGYGSIRAGALTDNNVIPPLYGYTDDIDFKNESLFALQASTKLNKDWSATIVMQARGDNDFDIEARWAYLNYKVSPQTTMTLGRFALPFFKSSDSKDIGFSHNYSRLPISIYQNFDFASIDGIRLAHSLEVADGDLVLKASYGNWDGNLESQTFGDIPSSMKNIMQLSAEYNWEWLTLFAGGFVGEWSSDLDSSLDFILIAPQTNGGAGLGDMGYSVSGGTMLSPSGALYNMDSIYANEEDGSYISVGVAIDYENYLFNAEYAQYGVDDSISEDKKAFFVAVGYRFDDFIFTVVHQKLDHDLKLEQANQSTDPLLVGTINAVVSSISKASLFDTTGFHIRYDAAPGVAVKAEYTYIHSEAANDDVGLVALGVDFVF